VSFLERQPKPETAMTQAETQAAPGPAGAATPATLDVVIPVYNEQEVLPELLRRLGAACGSVPGLRWRVIFVDDGSHDHSAEILLTRQKADAHVAVLRLSRNFGHQAAISAGLAHADADAVVVMDADLQDPPELIPELVAAWRGGGQVVLAQRRSRKERGLRRLGFEAFGRVLALMADFPVARDAGVFSLLDRAAVAQITGLGERHRFLPGLRSWIGFDQRVVGYDRQERAASQPKQSFRRLVRYALDGIFSFSYLPLRMMTYLGLLVSLTGLAVAGYFVLKRLLGAEKAPMGFTTLVTLVLLLGGLNLTCLGLLGEYIGRIYDEVKQRPIYIIGSRHGLAAPGPRGGGGGGGGVNL
jgi:dolichol-phosphate mannosyltransferase